jgi:hypothetical protein
MAGAVDKWKVFEQIDYHPHPKQLLYHNSDARFKVPVCGRRFGKSKMAGSDLVPRMFEPNKMFWAVGPTYDLGEKEFRVVWEAIIRKLGFGKKQGVLSSYSKKQGNMFIEMPWGTRLEVRSADRPDSLVGEGLDHVIMCEAAKHQLDTWERFIRPALADKRGSADFPTTPEGHNWLYQLWRYGRNPEFKDMYSSWRFPSWDNPVVYPGGRYDPEILLLEKTTSPEWFMQEIGADFASFVGKIYGEWDETVHVQTVPFRSGLPNYIAFDWGFVNPLAAIEFQVQPDDTIRIWREHYKPFLTLEQHINELRNRDQPDGYHLDGCFGDSEDPEAVATVSEKFAPCMALPEAKQNWRQGVELVKTFLRPYEYDTDEFGGPLERPHLLVDHDCPNVAREFNLYRVKRNVRGLDPQEAANKIDDHAMDAIRYGLMHLFVLGARHSLAEVMEPTSVGSPNYGLDDTFFSNGGQDDFTMTMAMDF